MDGAYNGKAPKIQISCSTDCADPIDIVCTMLLGDQIIRAKLAGDLSRRDQLASTFTIKWKNFFPEDSTWESLAELERSCQALILEEKDALKGEGLLQAKSGRKRSL